MNTLTAEERKLKAIIEDMGVGCRIKAFRSEMNKKLLSPHFNGITYDEAIGFVKDTEEQLGYMTAHDTAYLYLIEQKNRMLKWATALNDDETMGRHDHELPVHALVSVGSITVECNFHIPQLHYRPHERQKIINTTLREKIARSSEMTGSLRHLNAIDFIEL